MLAALPRILWASPHGKRLKQIVATVAVATVVVGGASLSPNVPILGGGDPGACASSTQYVPDGPDPWGGCWPGEANTGPNAPSSTMATYTGSCTINTPNVTIDSRVINCSPLNVGSNAGGLLIDNSYLNGGVSSSGSAAFTIEDSLLDNKVLYPACTGPTTCAAGYYACGDPNNQTTDCGVTGHNFTIRRTEIINSNRAAYCTSPGPCTIQDSYFHGTNLWPDDSNLAHASSVRNEQNLTLTHNSLHCSYEGPFPNGDLGCSADMSGYPDFVPIHHLTAHRNMFMANNIGNGFCVYGGATNGKPFSNHVDNATYIVFTQNVFQRGANGKCGAYGHVEAYNGSRTGNVWSGNIFDNGLTAGPT